MAVCGKRGHILIIATVFCRIPCYGINRIKVVLIERAQIVVCLLKCLKECVIMDVIIVWHNALFRDARCSAVGFRLCDILSVAYTVIFHEFCDFILQIPLYRELTHHIRCFRIRSRVIRGACLCFNVFSIKVALILLVICYRAMDLLMDPTEQIKACICVSLLIFLL